MAETKKIGELSDRDLLEFILSNQIYIMRHLEKLESVVKNEKPNVTDQEKLFDHFQSLAYGLKLRTDSAIDEFRSGKK